MPSERKRRAREKPLTAQRRYEREAAVAAADAPLADGRDFSTLDVRKLLPPIDLPGQWEDHKPGKTVDLLERQEALLRGVIAHGQLEAAVLDCAMESADGAERFSMRLVNKWVEDNTYGFRQRFKEAERFYASRLEKELARLAFRPTVSKDEKPDHQPLITALNAYVPTKFTTGRAAPHSSEKVDDALQTIARGLRESKHELAPKPIEEGDASAISKWLEQMPVAEASQEA